MYDDPYDWFNSLDLSFNFGTGHEFDQFNNFDFGNDFSFTNYSSDSFSNQVTQNQTYTDLSGWTWSPDQIAPTQTPNLSSDPTGGQCLKVGQYYHAAGGWCTIASMLNCIPADKQPDMQTLLNSIASRLGITVDKLLAQLNKVDSLGNPNGGLSKDDINNGLLPAIAGLTGVQMRTANIPTNPEAAASAMYSLTTYLGSGSPLMMTYIPKSNNFLQGGHAVQIQSAGNGNVNLVDPADSAPHADLKSVDDVLNMYMRTPGRNIFFVVPESMPTPRYQGP